MARRAAKEIALAPVAAHARQQDAGALLRLGHPVGVDARTGARAADRRAAGERLLGRRRSRQRLTERTTCAVVARRPLLQQAAQLFKELVHSGPLAGAGLHEGQHARRAIAVRTP